MSAYDFALLHNAFNDACAENAKLKKENNAYARANRELREAVKRLITEKNQHQAALERMMKNNGDCIKVAEQAKSQELVHEKLLTDCVDKDRNNVSLCDRNVELRQKIVQLGKQLKTQDAQLGMLQDVNDRLVKSAFQMNENYVALMTSYGQLDMNLIGHHGRVAVLERANNLSAKRIADLQAVSFLAVTCTKNLQVQLLESQKKSEDLARRLGQRDNVTRWLYRAHTESSSDDSGVQLMSDLALEDTPCVGAVSRDEQFTDEKSSESFSIVATSHKSEEEKSLSDGYSLIDETEVDSGYE